MSSYNFTNITGNVAGVRKGGGGGTTRLIMGTAYNVLNTDDGRGSSGRGDMGKGMGPKAMEIFRKMNRDGHVPTAEELKILWNDDYVRLSPEALEANSMVDLPILIEHDNGKRVGKIKKGWANGNEIFIVAEVTDKDAIAAIDDGSLPSLSMGYGLYGVEGKEGVERKIMEVSLCRTPFYKGCDIMVAASGKNPASASRTMDSSGGFAIRSLKPEPAEEAGEVSVVDFFSDLLETVSARRQLFLCEPIKKKTFLKEETGVNSIGEARYTHLATTPTKKDQTANDMTTQAEHPSNSILERLPPSQNTAGTAGEDDDQKVIVTVSKLDEITNAGKKLAMENNRLKEALMNTTKESEATQKRLKTYQNEYVKRQKVEFEDVLGAIQSTASTEMNGVEGVPEGEVLSEEDKKQLESFFYDTERASVSGVMAKMAKEIKSLRKELISKAKEDADRNGVEGEDDRAHADQGAEIPLEEEVPEDAERDPRDTGTRGERVPQNPARRSIASKPTVADLYKSNLKQNPPQKTREVPRQPPPQNTRATPNRKRNQTMAFNDRTPLVEVKASRTSVGNVARDPETDLFDLTWKAIQKTPKQDIGAVNALETIPQDADAILFSQYTHNRRQQNHY